MIDFLVCEIFPEWKMACRLFYHKRGPQLKDHKDMNDKLIEVYDIVISEYVLELALANLNEKRFKSWKKFKEEIDDILAA